MLDPLRSTIFSTLPGTLGQQETNRLSEQHEWDAQISVGSTESVKGLEFDAVVVVQPGRIEQDAPLASGGGFGSLRGYDQTDAAIGYSADRGKTKTAFAAIR